MMYGYICGSKGAQSLVEQREALQAVQCSEMIEEHDEAKGRPALNRVIGALRRGDAIVVTSLDRLATTLPDLLETFAEIIGKGAHVRSVKEGIDTQSLGEAGDEFSHILQSMLFAERAFLIERVQAGRANAMRKGVKLGRRNKLTSDQVLHAKRLLELGEGARPVARTFGVSEATLYRYIRNQPK